MTQMKRPLAVATVTECLKALLHDGLSMVSDCIGGFEVTSLAPDLVDAANLAANRLNVFLYQITPNGALRNADLPTRTDAGEHIRRHVLAIDLHYLVTAYSKNESQAEVMLGQSAYMLHDRPSLTPNDIRAREQAWAVGSSTFLQKLAASGLSSQVEMVRVTPQVQSTEELSKLWSAFQVHYRPSLAYVASVVLIEAEGPSRAPLPVLRIGAEDRGPTVGAGLVLPIPLLVQVALPGQQPTLLLGSTVSLEGHHLDGSNPEVDFAGLRDGRRLVATLVQDHTAMRVTVKLADAKDVANPALAPEEAWSVGSYAVAARVRKAGESSSRTTNRLIVTLAPTMSSLTLAQAAGGKLRATVKCSPRIAAGQRASLVIGDWEMSAAPIAQPVGTLVFEAEPPARIRSGEEYVCRLKVDEVESHFIDRTASPPAFLGAAKRTIP